MKKQVLAEFDYTHGAIRAIDELYTAFLAQFKRKPVVDLFYGELWGPTARFPRRDISAYWADDAAIAQSEVDWMKKYLRENCIGEVTF
jgi:hypothetical protein